MNDNNNTTRNIRELRYKKKKTPLSPVAKAGIWAVIFLLCFLIPFLIVYLGNTAPKKPTGIEPEETVAPDTPENQIYQLQRENEALRQQVRELEAKIDELTRTPSYTETPESQGELPADNGGWEEVAPVYIPETPQEETASEEGTETAVEESYSEDGM